MRRSDYCFLNSSNSALTKKQVENITSRLFLTSTPRSSAFKFFYRFSRIFEMKCHVGRKQVTRFFNVIKSPANNVEIRIRGRSRFFQKRAKAEQLCNRKI